MARSPASAPTNAPHSSDKKDVEFERAANGISSIEIAFPLIWTHLVETGRFTLSEIVSIMSCNPAELLRIDRGSLSVGKVADVLIFDPETERAVNPQEFYSKGKNCPYTGEVLRGLAKYGAARRPRCAEKRCDRLKEEVRMELHEVKILRKTKLAENEWRFDFDAPALCAEAVPGQFVMVETSHGPTPFLRRAISINQCKDGVLSLMFAVVGEGTEALAATGRRRNREPARSPRARL